MSVHLFNLLWWNAPQLTLTNLPRRPNERTCREMDRQSVGYLVFMLPLLGLGLLMLMLMLAMLQQQQKLISLSQIFSLLTLLDRWEGSTQSVNQTESQLPLMRNSYPTFDSLYLQSFTCTAGYQIWYIHTHRHNNNNKSLHKQVGYSILKCLYEIIKFKFK